MPGGRLRMEKLGALVSAGKLDVHPLASHVFEGRGASGGSAVYDERQAA